MIYGPYTRKGKVRTAHLQQRTKRRSYNARPCRAVIFLRFSFAACVTALLILGVRMLLLEHTVLELSVMTTLSGIAVLLLCLMRRMNHRRRS